MAVGVLQFRLHVHEAQSLKDKRRVLQGLMERLRNDHGVSVAEVGSRDAHQDAQLELALVLSDPKAIHSALTKIVDFLRLGRSANLIEHEIEVL